MFSCSRTYHPRPLLNCSCPCSTTQSGCFTVQVRTRDFGWNKCVLVLEGLNASPDTDTGGSPESENHRTKMPNSSSPASLCYYKRANMDERAPCSHSVSCARRDWFGRGRRRRTQMTRPLWVVDGIDRCCMRTFSPWLVGSRNRPAHTDTVGASETASINTKLSSPVVR